ncbi:CLN3_protein [Hexamita inflata]|uniref:CLN3 protein n=1 Tax=Hexamita inflata TaxID=28002 RepID=A0AA86NNJ0_9EUKA|nr:CLN3 protein [Hexamita inflata]
MPETIINVVGFLMLGWTNNFGYAIMLSAAEDLIGDRAPTAVVLLCDILPSFLIVLLYPLFQHKVKTWVTTLVAAAFSVLGFIFAGLSQKNYVLGLIGVIFTSLQQGLGESSLLAYSSLFQSSCVAAWSFGTGLAGLTSTFLYMLLTTILKLDKSLIIWCFSPMPAIFLVSFWITKPAYQLVTDQDEQQSSLSFTARLSLLKPHLLVYVSMFAVFTFEYSIMSGVDAVLDYPSNPGMFYTYSCFASQIGVFLARASLSIVKLPYFFIPTLFIVQAVNLVLFSLEAKFYYVNSFWGMLVWVAFMGLCGGLTYGNGVYQLQVRGGDHSKFLLSAASCFINLGILTASGIASLLQTALEK